MKTIPPPCLEPELGRKYWRSLDQLAETPEFRQWVEREFPAGASEWTDPVSRRHFVKIMSASFLLAGMGLAGSGCRRPVETIVPFGKMPENYIHGVPQYYATAMPSGSGAVPLVVKSNEGRPTKVEGNPLHPDHNGGTDRFAQASILNLYDPDRSTRFLKDGNATTAQAAQTFLDGLAEQYRKSAGKGLSLLAETSSSPSRLRLQKLIAEKLPQSRWYRFDPVDHDIHRRATSLAFGRPLKARYRFDLAKVIVSLDCDFLGSEEDVHNNIRLFAQGRRLENAQATPTRLYAIESLLTLTGANADHRLRVPSSSVLYAATSLAASLKVKVPALEGSLPSGSAEWLSGCASDLQEHRGRCLVVAGHRQPQAVHLLAHALNQALGNVGTTVLLQEVPETREGDIAELARALSSGEVETLVMLGSNPAYTAPIDLNWANLQSKARVVVRLGYYEDETAATWHLPAAHYLESWGDARSSDGTLLPIQPLIAPLFGGLTEIEVLARIAGIPDSAYKIVRATFAEFIRGDNEAAWRKFLHDGFLPNSAAAPVAAKLNDAALASEITNLKPAAAGRNNLEVVFHRDYKLDDGRYNNNGWLQELPDPITKVVWDNVVLISRKTAQELGVKSQDLVEVKLGDRAVNGAIWVQPGMADYSLGLSLGYGRKNTGRVGRDVGFNAYLLRARATENFALGATVRPLGRTHQVVCTQDHWSLEGRPIIREANLEQYRKKPDFVKAMNAEKPPVEAPLYPNPFDKVKDQGLHQWGMSIDLNACVGCSACMLACQSENNVPIVGKDQVRRGREMHWLRIDRYYSGVPQKRKFIDTFKLEAKQQFEDWIDDPQVVTQPMLCQHCEAAPCENVCPVNATVHDQEGLNLMVYNRCVGTRYCSNNCPYKIRKFNYFDYNKRPIDKLYHGPFGRRKDDEWDLMKMLKNPDVTVRMRGVMEKCTFCIQRIEQAKIAQKVKAGPSGDVVVPRDSFTTACAQACPAGAIVFGNLNDPEAQVSKQKQNERDYTVLEFLLTKPRLTYLARVRNPKPGMPDYHEAPLSYEEYEHKMHGGHEPHAASHEKKGAH